METSVNGVGTFRQCKACGESFPVGGRKGKKLYAVFCSRDCHQKSRYHRGRQCNKLAPEDAGYIAGFMDGEGSIILHRRYTGSVGLMLDLSNTSRRPLEWMIETAGVGYFGLTRRRSPRHRDCHSWRVSGDAAASLLRQIVGLMKVKQRQAKLAIAFQKRLETPSLKADRSWQMEWMGRMKEMNARGTKP